MYVVKQVKTRSGLVALQFEEGYPKNMNHLISMEIIYRIWQKIQSNIKIAFKNSMHNQRRGLIKCLSSSSLFRISQIAIFM